MYQYTLLLVLHYKLPFRLKESIPTRSALELSRLPLIQSLVPVKMSGVYEEIDSLRQALEQSYAAQEFEKLSKLYTEECIFMPPDQPMMRGRHGVLAAVNQMWEGGIRKVEIKMEEAVGIGDDMAYSRGFLNFSLGDGTVVFKGKYLVLWKRVNGKFHLFTDIFNSTKKTSSS